MRRRTPHIVLEVLLCVCSVPVESLAQSTDQPALERGVHLRRQGRDAEALEVFARAYELRPSARARAQIALAEQALAKWTEAERDLIAALAQGDDAWIAKNRVSLEQSLSVVREHLATVRIVCTAKDTRASANGIPSTGALSEGIRVPAGNVLLEVEAPGYAAKRFVIVVPPGATREETVDLTPMSTAPSTTADAERQESSRSRKGASEEQASLTSPFLKQSAPPVPAWAAATAAGVLLTEGVIAHVLRERLVSRYNDDTICWRPDQPRSQVCAAYKTQAETALGLAIAGYGLGGLAALGAAYLFAVPSHSRHGIAVNVDQGVSVAYSTTW